MGYSQGVTVSVQGLADTITGFDGDVIQDGSRVEIGYFLGVDASVDPTTYSASGAWDTFTVLGTTTTQTVLFDTIDGGADYTGQDFDSDTDFSALPADQQGAGLDVRIGVRIFDDLESGRFNTYTILGDPARLEEPQAPPIPGAGTADLTTTGARIVWEDNANPFQTSIAAIPEPSTSLSALLGLGLLIGSRRRK